MKSIRCARKPDKDTLQHRGAMRYRIFGFLQNGVYEGVG
jgi:hypothetical protein